MFHLLQRLRRPPGPAVFDRQDIPADGAFDYLGLASRCTTQNSYNRLHIELENVCTPLELASIAELGRYRTLPRRSRGWLQRLRLLKPELFSAPHPYARSAIGKRIFFYRDPLSEPRGRDLLLAFTGNARRLMLPISVFLQFVDPAKWDVLVVTKEVGRSYLQGLDEVAEDFPGLVAHIERALKLADYRRVVTFGTSSGGFPAVWAALLVNAERGISVCGIPPNPIPEAAIQSDATSRSPNLCYIYGSECLRDHDASLALERLYRGQLIPVRDAKLHNVMDILLKRGELVEFIDQILG